MTTDYDAPRTAPEDEPDSEALELTRAQETATARAQLMEESETEECRDLPDADLSELGLTLQVLPRQDDEFICAACFLICHRSQLVLRSDAQQTCVNCAA